MEKLYIPVLTFLFVVIFMVFSRAEIMASSQKKYFSKSYQIARESFLKAAQKVGASIESFQNPHMGPLGEALFTDVAIIGSKHATDYLVLGSGTHGVEGFAGSDIQTGLLREGIHNELRAENWLHQYGGVNHPRAQEIKTELLHAFYPNTDDWNQSIWEHGKKIVNQALRNF